MYNRNHKPVPISFIAICIVILIILWLVESTIGYDKYNGGICRSCGGTYIFQQAVGHKYTTDYIYKCDKCGNLIEVNNYYGDENAGNS